SVLISVGSARHEGLAVAYEWRLHHFRVQKLAADVHLHLLAGTGGHACESDGPFESRRECAAGDLAVAETSHGDLLVTAKHAAVLQHEPDELGSRALGLD